MSTRNADRRATARDKLAAERARQAAAQQRQRRLLLVAIPLVVVVIAVAVGIVATRGSGSSSASAPRPTGVAAVGAGFTTGTAGKPVIDLWEDFQCPICKQFEGSDSAKAMRQLAADGKAQLVIHPLSFLDDNLGNDSSKRAAAAFGCAIDAGKGLEYHDAVYAHQPEKEGAGYTDAQLLSFGTEAGITGPAYDTFQQCVKAGTYDGWAGQVQHTMEQHGITGTPTIQVAGKSQDLQTLSADSITRAVTAAAGS
ncbi:protein-disulfide isomerase [Motilibacter rhizosphaerae]|uniref:Protein-disulfide isomerase n=1 Tax=Motilibacter rhizosphaerae TaxID=598652 RepID=A0A4V2F3E9_9ACTN|nr:thioredoxin domain-containing protein [Motilibacter rhizosphaerae]RZS82873.1 protein-disulfide isomerase [Motilibacter rhizosphaerae]